MKDVKLSPVEILAIVAAISFAIAILAKLLLWLQVKQKRRPKFWKSFFTFYSQHDIYNRSSLESKRFRSGNNILNTVYLISVLLIIVAYMLGTDGAKDTTPQSPKKQTVR